MDNLKCCVLENCDKKNIKKYGDYCCKHKRNYLVKNDEIIIDNYTGKNSDYLKNDLNNFYYKIENKKYKGKKENLFLIVDDYIKKIKSYNIKDVIKMQAYFRGKIIRYKYNYKKCNNNEDFWSYEKLQDIQSKYFFSYCDKNKIHWGFDIRSLEKLIELKYPNPYTTECISPRVIEEVKKKINKIKRNKSYENISDIVNRDRKSNIKQKTVDLFLQIEQLGYSCLIDWFLNLSLYKTKELYKQLEDIWNYRSQLSVEMKREICPPNGRIFTTSIPLILRMGKEDIQEIILNDIQKFNNCENLSNRRLGYMYFIIGLSNVSAQCYMAHQDWVAFIY